MLIIVGIPAKFARIEMSANVCLFRTIKVRTKQLNTRLCYTFVIRE
ncbi:hypothetical protein GVAMD_0057 [Gardnerella vaginalis AMD]|nr:hypothetical protein GVAMD_0057 [Gardnerella vaginalis AMD]EFH72264.1 hypothetical protein GV51_0567 [Gardnerella vaginalis 5-1]